MCSCWGNLYVVSSDVTTCSKDGRYSNSWFRDICSSCKTKLTVFITETVLMRDRHMKWKARFVHCCNHGNWPEKMKVNYTNTSKRTLLSFQSHVVSEHVTSNWTEMKPVSRITSLLVSSGELLGIIKCYSCGSFIPSKQKQKWWSFVSRLKSWCTLHRIIWHRTDQNTLCGRDRR